jgi:hypothetical protein
MVLWGLGRRSVWLGFFASGVCAICVAACGGRAAREQAVDTHSSGGAAGSSPASSSGTSGSGASPAVGGSGSVENNGNGGSVVASDSGAAGTDEAGGRASGAAGMTPGGGGAGGEAPACPYECQCCDGATTQSTPASCIPGNPQCPAGLSVAQGSGACLVVPEVCRNTSVEQLQGQSCELGGPVCAFGCGGCGVWECRCDSYSGSEPVWGCNIQPC